MTARRYLLLLLALFGAGVAVWAETPDVDTIEANLKRRDARVEQISDQLDAGDVSDATLDSHSCRRCSDTRTRPGATPRP